MKLITTPQVTALSQAALKSPRRRANQNLHSELSDPIQRLAIAMAPDSYVRPHRHPHTWELLTSLRGRFLGLHFDEGGRVVARTVLGEDSAAVETPANTYHSMLALDDDAVLLEVKHGPYLPINDFAPWSPPEGPGVPAFVEWMKRATVGARWTPA